MKKLIKLNLSKLTVKKNKYLFIWIYKIEGGIDLSIKELNSVNFTKEEKKIIGSMIDERKLQISTLENEVRVARENLAENTIKIKFYQEMRLRNINDYEEKEKERREKHNTLLEEYNDLLENNSRKIREIYNELLVLNDIFKTYRR